jgi:uncharacterized protein YbjT (DUF2867 family)
MSSCPVIAVIGATGVRGGGLARAILADPARSFAVRAVTSRSDGVAARALAALGAQVVEAELDDAASLERALRGAYGVFGDLEQANHIAQAARRAAVRHVIWSTREDTHRDEAHCDAASEADALFRDLPATLLRISFLWDNLIHLGLGLQRSGDGVLEFVLPMGNRRLPGIAAADIGPCALGIFQRCGQFIGRTVGIAGEHLDGAQIAAALSAAIGEPVRYVPTSFADYARLGLPSAGDLAYMLRYEHHCNDTHCADGAVDLTRELHPGLTNFEQWLADNAHGDIAKGGCSAGHRRP